MKKYAIGIIVVLFAVVTAFTARPAFNTYQFNGSSNDPAERTDPLEYSLASPSCGGAENVLCTIDAADNNGRPVIGAGGDPLYDALYNGGSTVGPNFAPVYVTGHQ